MENTLNKKTQRLEKIIEKSKECRLCESLNHSLIRKFEKPLKGENIFGIKKYYRELWRCSCCGIFFNSHEYNLESIYKGEYRKAAYNGDKIHERFNQVMALPKEKSDNRNRVEHIISFFESKNLNLKKKVLDIGSGMGVFPAVMTENQWDVLAIDPDPMNLKITKELGKSRVLLGTFPDIKINEKFSLITFNKVLEHVIDPIYFLKTAKKYLNKSGYIYLELPDGENAILDSPLRQEFFLEHHYIFTPASICLMVNKAGLYIEKLDKIKDPSGKNTLAAFLYQKK